MRLRWLFFSVLALSVVWGREPERSEPFGPDSYTNLFHDTTPAGLARLRAEMAARQSNSTSNVADSMNVRLVGRWPFGNAYGVRPSDHFVQDSLAFIETGSGIRILRCSNPALPQMVGKIDCAGILYSFPMCGSGVVCQDSVVYVVSWNSSLEIFDIRDPVHSVRLGSAFLGGPPQGLDLRDTFAFSAGFDSMFRVVNVADRANPVQVVAMQLPDIGVGVAIRDTVAYVACYHAGLVAISIANPHSPRILSSVGGFTGSHVVLGGNLAYVAGGAGGLHMIDISNPGALHEEGRLESTPGTDVWQIGMFAYMTGYTNYDADFYIIDVSNPTSPSLISHASSPGWGCGLWAMNPYGYAYATDHWEGLHVYDISDPVHPQLDTVLFGASEAYDVSVSGQLALFADKWAGVKVLSLAGIGSPTEIGCCDTAGQGPDCEAVAAKDSFAFLRWRNTGAFTSVDISDPTHPRIVGSATPIANNIRDMAVRDSLVYAVKDYKFEVYSIANPRSPRLVGSLGLSSAVSGLCVTGGIACIAGSSVFIVDISDPAHPSMEGTYNCDAVGVDVVDTILYVAAWHQGLRIVSVADPANPREIAVCPIEGRAWDVVVAGGTAYVGGTYLRLVDIRDPANPVEFGHYSPPDQIRRVFWQSGLLYAACFSAGVCIFETVQTAIAERNSGASVPASVLVECRPNPASSVVSFALDGGITGCSSLSLFDLDGRRVRDLAVPAGRTSQELRIDVGNLKAGVYLAVWRNGRTRATTKLIKR